MKIYIVRHGETEWNKMKRIQGRCDSDLTSLGVEDAKKLGASLKDVEFRRVYSSPSGRAFSTAKYICGDERNVEIITNDLFREMNFGIWEGMNYEDIEIQYKDDYYNLWNRPEKYDSSKIKAESYEEILERARKGLQYIVDNNKGEKGNILLTTHTVFIKAIYSNIKKLELKDFWSDPYVYNTCLSILDVDENNNYKFLLEADVSHLKYSLK